jgi:hypothetical protein
MPAAPGRDEPRRPHRIAVSGMGVATDEHAEERPTPVFAQLRVNRKGASERRFPSCAEGSANSLRAMGSGGPWTGEPRGSVRARS